MEPIKAKFAGTCARTGQSYPAGALIVKLASGKWALAQTRAGAVKVAPDLRLCRLPDGTERDIPVNLPSYCKTCLEADGHSRDTVKSLAPDVLAQYVRVRNGDEITCQRCGSSVQIIPQAELDQRKRDAEAEIERNIRADMEANLRLVHAGCGFYQLSHRLPDPMWKAVASHFRYWSADDMDEMDYFDMGGGYYLVGGATAFDPANLDTYLNGAPPSSMSRAEQVERILNIKPENTLAAQRERAIVEKAAAQERAQAQIEREQTKARLFTQEEGEYVRAEKESIRLEGEYVKWRGGFSIYGTGTEFCVCEDSIWLLENNGMDGDDWSRNNVRTGGAGAVGLRYAKTPERLEFLNQLKEVKTRDI